MFSLQLADGTLIKGLNRLSPSTFEIINNDKTLYHQLNNFNLSFAVLFDEDDVMSEVYLDYTLQNYIEQNHTIKFNLISFDELNQLKEKKQKKYNEKMKKRRERK